ncbi:DUF3488 and transglutaminase-like domain-containing protein [Hydrogenophaga sp. 5NK40-0174]|uniref:transglutaminase family protein n=1 Tax=Hydrogenophaga sp. 5NK40-0174 TaxID=3127649 RepID=UPI00310893E3
MLKHTGARLESLPREVRDTLFLLAVVSWIILLQAPNIPISTTVVSLGAVAWRARTTLLGRPLPGWPLRIAWLIAALVGTAMHYHTLLGKEPGVSLVIALLALKNLEMRAKRDAFVLFFLGFFALLTHLFYSQSLLSAAGIVIGLMGLLTGLVNAHMPAGHPSIRTSAGIASKLVLTGAPVMVALFVLFPRIDPLWGLPAEKQAGSTGLSETMEIGQITELALSDEVAFRVNFDGAVPPDGDLYFRGPVLASFDGRRWTRERRPASALARRGASFDQLGRPIKYEILMEPHGLASLLTLDLTVRAPAGLSNRSRLTSSGQWRTERPIRSLVRYSGEAHLDYRLEPDLAPEERLPFLYLPRGSNPRTVALGQDLRKVSGAGPEGDDRLIAAALDQLRTGGYSYTLEPGAYGADAADQFWFDTKEGFCEHIASSFVILARASGIPARIVTGYLGAENNTFDGQWIVRQRNAHAWTELWLHGRGWVRIDPTGAVFPGRLGRLESLTLPSSGLSGAVASMSPTWGTRLRNAWDAIDGTWKRLVVDYTQEEQLNLLEALGFDSPSWADLGYVLAGLIVLGAMLGGGWSLWERRHEDPWLRLLRKAQQRMSAKHLIAAEDHLLTPRGLMARLRDADTDPAFLSDMGNWLMRMERMRYARGSRDTLGTLKTRLAQMRWPA